MIVERLGEIDKLLLDPIIIIGGGSSVAGWGSGSGSGGGEGGL